MSSSLAIINNTEIVINIYINIMRKGLWPASRIESYWNFYHMSKIKTKAAILLFFFCFKLLHSPGIWLSSWLKVLGYNPKTGSNKVLWFHTHAHTHVLSIYSPCMQESTGVKGSTSKYAQHFAGCGPLSLFDPLCLLSSVFASSTNNASLQQQILSTPHWCLLPSFLEVLYSIYPQVT